MILSREEAKASGRTRYFDGVPCKNGHVCERYTLKGQCVECVSSANRTYCLKNPQKRKTERRKYYEEHRDVELPRAKEYQAALRAEGLDYYTRNVDEIRERKRLKRQANPEAARAKDRVARLLYNTKINLIKRAWEKRHPEKREEKKRNRRAKIAGASGKHTAAQIKTLYEKQNAKCAFCFCKLRSKYEIDHYVPLARGGTNDITNIQLLCRPCNQKKHATDPIVFAQRNGRLL